MQALPGYCLHWLGSGWLTTECQTQKCLFHCEEAVNHSTFRLWLTAQPHAVLRETLQNSAGGM